MNLNDRIKSAKFNAKGSGIGISITKATSHEIIGPKKKHVDFIIVCLESDNVSIPETADMLLERTNNNSWVVVFKALVTTHHLMAVANERFIQYIASRTTTWTLDTFFDKSGVQGYDMSSAIKKYAKYLSEKAFTYRTMGYDFCRIPRGKEKGTMRNMDTTKLLNALVAMQAQIDALIAVEISSADLCNGVITAAFMLLFKDLIRLFACYNDGIINLLEKFFEMKKADCKTALDIYKRFLARMDRVSEFLKIAEDVGIDRTDIPDLSKAPSSLLEALEEHYQSLEKGRPIQTPHKPVTIAAFNLTDTQSSAIDAAAFRENFQAPASAASGSGGGGGGGATASFSSTGVDTQDRAALDYLDQERKALEQFEKVKRESVKGPAQNGVATQQSRPATSQLSFSSQHAAAQPVQAPSAQPAQRPIAQNAQKASDDLLLIDSNPNASIQPNALHGFDAYRTQGMPSYGGAMQAQGMGDARVDFNAAFQQQPPSSSSVGFPNLMDEGILAPERPDGSGGQQGAPSWPDASQVAGQSAGGAGQSLNIDHGLQRAAKSLDEFTISAPYKTMSPTGSSGHQWTQAQSRGMTGGANFRGTTPIARSTIQAPVPVVQPMGWGMQAGMQPMGVPIMNRPAYGMQPMVMPGTAAYQPGFPQQPMMMQQAMYLPPGAAAMNRPPAPRDPFGL